MHLSLYTYIHLSERSSFSFYIDIHYETRRGFHSSGYAAASVYEVHADTILMENLS
jgi:hypothetical protein